ncbi:hypothetical protein [uncultured Devosia sp.]|uniref:hypothetical protein n=1 Tax=uncultured Devosia sp. TaxID=211434 RepID=UPI0035CC9E1B
MMRGLARLAALAIVAIVSLTSLAQGQGSRITPFQIGRPIDQVNSFETALQTAQKGTPIKGTPSGTPNHVTTVYKPAPYRQLYTVWIGDNGAVRVVNKDNNGRWQQAYDVTPSGLGIPGSPVTAVWQAQNDQMEIFWVDGTGTVNLVWSDHNSWHAPVRISPFGYFPAGAQLSGVWQPVAHELMVFGIDDRGVLKMMWKKDNGSWRPSGDMSGVGHARPGSSVAAVYQPLDQRTEVFSVTPNGTIAIVWKSRDNAWAQPELLTPPGLAPDYAPLSATWYGPSNQIEVFWVDRLGGLNVVWSHDNSRWAVQTIAGSGFAAPGSSVSAVYQPLHEHLEVFGVTAKGGVTLLWKQNNGGWSKPQQIVPDNAVPTATVLRAAYLAEGKQLETFYIDAVGQLWDVWKANDGGWSTPPVKLTDIGGSTIIKPGECSVFLDRWSKFRIDDDYMITQCGRILGITAYCDARNAFVAVDYVDNGRKRVLICSSRYIKDSAAEQVEHIARGVKQGVSDAAVAMMPLVNFTVQGAGCIAGNMAACASAGITLVQVFDQLTGNSVLPSEVRAALPLIKRAVACAGGDFIGCATFAQDLVKKTTGVNIPAADVVQVGLDASDCYDGNVGACARLGQKAVQAAGLENVVIPSTIVAIGANVQDCLIESDLDSSTSKRDVSGSCLALGTSIATAAGLDADIARAGNLGVRCASGDQDACVALGFQAAREFVPPPLLNAVEKNGEACMGNKPSACFDIAIAAADAVGLPTGDLASLRNCAISQSIDACRPLAEKLTGVPLGSALDTAKLVSRCANGEVVACVELGRAAVRKYKPDTGSVVADRVLSMIQRQALEGGRPGVPTLDQLGLPATQGLNVQDQTRLVSDLPTLPLPGVNVRFDGQWDTRVQGGTPYTMTLAQEASGRVSGSYTAGTLTDGVIVDRALYAHWHQGGLSGMVMFRLADDGQRFEGVWSQADKPTSQGTWSGQRPGAVADAKVTPIAPPPPASNPAPAAAPPPVIPAMPATPAPAPAPVVPATPPTPAVPATPVQPPPPPPPPAPKVVVLPQGQCPAETAVVRQQINIRDGLTQDGKGGDIIGKAEGNSRIQCLACTDSWCLIAANNPHATVSRGYLDFELPQPVAQPPVPQPAARPEPQPPVQPAPAAVPAADFSGDWWVRTSTGIVEQVRINQQGPTVVGSYADNASTAGQFTGQVQGDTLVLNWQNNRGYTGTGTLTMRGDGSGFAGQFAMQQIPPAGRMPLYEQSGTWESFTPETSPAAAEPAPQPEPQPQPEPAALASFAGDWWVRTSTGLVQQFHIAQQGAVAGGNYIDTMGNASQFTGQVSGNTLVLNWQSANGYAGVGTFTMRADGSGFAGQYGVQMIPPVNQMAIYASGGTWESFIPTTSEDPDPVYGGCSACGPDVFVGPK